MTTAADLITRALQPMRDPDQDYFIDDELLGYLNDAVADLAARERLLRTAVNVVAASGALAIPSDVMSLRWVKSPERIEVMWLDEATFFAYQDADPDWPETSPLATTYSDKVWLHPAPEDGEVWEIGAYTLPAELTSRTDNFPLRRLYETKTVHYMRAQCYYRLGERDLGDLELAQYNMGLRPIEAVTDHQVPGRLAFAREGNAFDVDIDSIHRGE